MRRVCLLVVMLFASIMKVEAQTSFWTEAVYQAGGGGSFMQMDVSATSKFTPTLGVFSWSLVNKDWSESIVGGAYTPRPWVEFNLGVGVERDDHPFRSLGSVWFGGSRGSLYTVVEHGGSGFWYEVDGNLAVRTNFGVGFRSQRFMGIGPRIEVKGKNLMFWIVPIAWDPEKHGDTNTLVALRVSTP